MFAVDPKVDCPHIIGNLGESLNVDGVCVFNIFLVVVPELYYLVSWIYKWKQTKILL